MTGPDGGVGGGRMPPEVEVEARRLIAAALEEDVGPGDWTTLWTVDIDALSRAEIVAKEPLVVAGGELARMVFHEVEPKLVVELVCPDGAAVSAGTVVMRISGPARGILTAERTALNFLGRLSGIATLTRAFVSRVAGTPARIIDTRKTTPAWRRLEKWAVRIGGGANHRMGLHDMILIKDNHIAASGGIRAAASRVAMRNEDGLPVEVEVVRPDQVEELRGLTIQRILLDNMTDDAMREAVERVQSWPGPRPEVEASGNMTLDRVGAVARTGVDWISVGALTHSVRVADFSLRLDPPSGSAGDDL